MKPFAIITGDFVPTGGMDMPNLALARYLAEQGRPVHLVAHRVDASLLGRANVTVQLVPRPGGRHLLGEPLLEWVGRGVAQAVRSAGGRVVVNGGNCRFADVNWVHFVHAAYRSAPTGSRVRDARLALMAGLYRSRERAALRCARVVIGDSRRTRDDVLRYVPVSPSRAHSVYYGVDGSRFRPADRDRRAALREQLGWPAQRPVAAFVGALGDRRKGLDTLIAAWQSLARLADWDADLVVIGSGAELPSWQARIADAGLAERVRFLGFRRDVPELLAAADLLVAPTRYEPYGQGVAEAMACGLPVLVSASAGVAERVPAELAGDWLLPDAEDVADLAARLLRWRSDPRRWDRWLSPLSEQIRAHTWDRMAAEMLAVIEADSQ